MAMAVVCLAGSSAGLHGLPPPRPRSFPPSQAPLLHRGTPGDTPADIFNTSNVYSDTHALTRSLRTTHWDRRKTFHKVCGLLQKAFQ